MVQIKIVTNLCSAPSLINTKKSIEAIEKTIYLQPEAFVKKSERGGSNWWMKTEWGFPDIRAAFLTNWGVRKRVEFLFTPINNPRHGPAHFV